MNILLWFQRRREERGRRLGGFWRGGGGRRREGGRGGGSEWGGRLWAWLRGEELGFDVQRNDRQNRTQNCWIPISLFRSSTLLYAPHLSRETAGLDRLRRLNRTGKEERGMGIRQQSCYSSASSNSIEEQWRGDERGWRDHSARLWGYRFSLE